MHSRRRHNKYVQFRLGETGCIDFLVNISTNLRERGGEACIKMNYLMMARFVVVTERLLGYQCGINNYCKGMSVKLRVLIM